MAQYQDLLHDLLFRNNGIPMQAQTMPYHSGGPPMQAQTLPWQPPPPSGGLWGGMMGAQTQPPAQPPGGLFNFPSSRDMMDMGAPQQSPQQRIDGAFSALPQTQQTGMQGQNTQQYQQPVTNPTQDQIAQLNMLMNLMGQQRR